MKRQEFVEMLYPTIVRIAPMYGHACSRAVMAQALTESWKGNGISYLAKLNNFFGLKCGTSWKGKSVNLKTKEEYRVGTITTIKDNFRVYDSVEDGVKGYFDFINTKRYQNLKGVSDPERYLKLIRADGYATASNYVQACMKNLQYVPVDWNEEDYPEEMIIVESSILDGIAREVIAGMWGTGEQRKKKLKMSGYSYEQIQKRVNEIVRGGG